MARIKHLRIAASFHSRHNSIDLNAICFFLFDWTLNNLGNFGMEIFYRHICTLVPPLKKAETSQQCTIWFIDQRNLLKFLEELWTIELNWMTPFDICCWLYDIHFTTIVFETYIEIRNPNFGSIPSHLKFLAISISTLTS